MLLVVPKWKNFFINILLLALKRPLGQIFNGAQKDTLDAQFWKFGAKEINREIARQWIVTKYWPLSPTLARQSTIWTRISIIPCWAWSSKKQHGGVWQTFLFFDFLFFLIVFAYFIQRPDGHLLEPQNFERSSFFVFCVEFPSSQRPWYGVQSPVMNIYGSSCRHKPSCYRYMAQSVHWWFFSNYITLSSLKNSGRTSIGNPTKKYFGDRWREDLQPWGRHSTLRCYIYVWAQRDCIFVACLTWYYAGVCFAAGRGCHASKPVQNMTRNKG